MKNSLKMKEQRATLVEELQAAVDLATSEERDFTEAEETRQAEIHDEVKTLDGKITKAEETESILLRNVAAAAPADDSGFDLDMSELDYSLCALDAVLEARVDMSDEQMQKSMESTCPDLADQHAEYAKGL